MILSEASAHTNTANNLSLFPPLPSEVLKVLYQHQLIKLHSQPAGEIGLIPILQVGRSETQGGEMTWLKPC